MDEASCERELPMHLSEFEREVNSRIGESLTKSEIEELCLSLYREVVNADKKGVD